MGIFDLTKYFFFCLVMQLSKPDINTWKKWRIEGEKFQEIRQKWRWCLFMANIFQKNKQSIQKSFVKESKQNKPQVTEREIVFLDYKKRLKNKILLEIKFEGFSRYISGCSIILVRGIYYTFWNSGNTKVRRKHGDKLTHLNILIIKEKKKN